MCEEIRAEPTFYIVDLYLILAINPAMDISLLDQSHDVVLDFCNGPAKGSAHTVKLNGGEWLEVENNRPVPDLIRQVVHMVVQMYVNQVASLCSYLFRRSTCAYTKTKTYRVSGQ